ncbi:MAG: hypothetical protein M1824_000219 [Vezdaea acicularis]|nr:MAG: hypothetical protein M1824_000219 [Vezdaea acicularis]
MYFMRKPTLGKGGPKRLTELSIDVSAHARLPRFFRPPHCSLLIIARRRVICRWDLDEQILSPGACIRIAGAGPPPSDGKQGDKGGDGDAVVHVAGGDGADGGEEEDGADEEDPGNGDEVDGLAPAAEGVWPVNEADARGVGEARDDDGDVGEVEGRGGHVEDGDDGLGAADSDAVEGGGEGDDEPDGVDGRVRVRVDFAPEGGEGQGAVAGEGVGHARVGQHGGAAGEELDEDDKGPHGGAAGAAARVEEDLGGGEAGGRGEDGVEVGDAEAERDGDHPADDAGDEDGHADGQWATDGGVVRLLRHVGGAIVVGHRPCDGQEAKEKGEATAAPAGTVRDVSKDPTCGLLVRREIQQGDADSHGGEHVDRSKPDNNLMQGARGERADDAHENEEEDGKEDRLQRGPIPTRD